MHTEYLIFAAEIGPTAELAGDFKKMGRNKKWKGKASLAALSELSKDQNLSQQRMDI